MYPNKKQMHLMNLRMGTKRLIYNYYIDKKMEAANDGKLLTSLDMDSSLPLLYKKYAWLQKENKTLVKNIITEVEQDYRRSLLNKKTRCRHKKFGDKETYKIKNFPKGSIKLINDNHKIILSEFGEISIKNYRDITINNEKILSAVIARDETYDYYVSILVYEEDALYKSNPRNIVGIDLGIKNLIVTSDGKKYMPLDGIRKYEKKQKCLQQVLARKQMKSNNYNKARIKLAKLNKKIVNSRRFPTHHITKSLVRNYDIIVAENLDLKEMTSKGNNLNKYILNENFGEVLRQLEYKCQFYGKTFIKVDKYFPSSQLCSTCGYQNRSLKNLSVRSWICPNCHMEHDRDLNASINIMYEGLKIYYQNKYN